MTHLELLIPFALPQEMASDLLRQLQTPALASLLGRSKKTGTRKLEDFSRGLPHEYRLAQALQLTKADDPDNSPPLAACALQQAGLNTQSGTWFLLNPVHMHIARDHLILTDLRQLPITDAESRALFATAQSLLEEEGRQLHYCSAHTWLLQADAWAGLQTATPDAACGHNVDIWLPKGEAERAWRKLLNEIQMAWHIHPVNETRAEAGQPAINALWLWGAAPGNLSSLSQEGSHTPTVFHDAAIGPITHLLPGPPVACAQEALQIFAGSGAVVSGWLDSLSGPALASDWGTWLQHMQALEQNWFAPLQSALREGRLEQLSLTLTNSHALRTFSSNRHSHRKFWKSPSLSNLAP